ncbi:hypothetical protein [Kineosporia sp. A_224]|uniref:hypothetical protein n=1 Tax=Kineosporia sp. A_224 TaxID=1962180 RepID=UPI000B4B5E16|nr:hypothetical protein [Kineosporia sp. A_224]
MPALRVINRAIDAASIAAVLYVGWQVVHGVDEPRFVGPTVALIALSIASEMFLLRRRKQAGEAAPRQVP